MRIRDFASGRRYLKGTLLRIQVHVLIKSWLKIKEFLKAFGYGSHVITVLNSARRRHVNKLGNENKECEIPTVTLKLLIQIKISKYTSIRQYESKSEVLFLYQCIFRYFNPNKWFEWDAGISHSLFLFHGLFTWRR